MKIQTIKCKTCNTLIAACVEKYIDNVWLKSCSKYLNTGNVIIETVDRAVTFDMKLNDCCGKKVKL